MNFEIEKKLINEVCLNENDLKIKGEEKWKKILNCLVTFDSKKIKKLYEGLNGTYLTGIDYITTYLFNDAKYVRYAQTKYIDDVLEDLKENNGKKVKQCYEKTGVYNQYIIRTLLSHFLKDLFHFENEDPLQKFLDSSIKNDCKLLKKKFDELDSEKQLKLFLFLRRLLGKFNDRKTEYFKSIDIKDLSDNNFDELINKLTGTRSKILKSKFIFYKAYRGEDFKKKIRHLLKLYKDGESYEIYFFRRNEMIKFLDDLKTSGGEIIKKKYRNLDSIDKCNVMIGLETILEDNYFKTDNCVVSIEEWNELLVEVSKNNGNLILKNYDSLKIRTKYELNQILNYLYDEKEIFVKYCDFLADQISNIDYIYNIVFFENEERIYLADKLKVEGEKKWKEFLNDLSENNGNKIIDNYNKTDSMEKGLLISCLKNLLEYDGKKLLYYDLTEIEVQNLLNELLENECENLKLNYNKFGPVGQYQMRVLLDYSLNSLYKYKPTRYYSNSTDYLEFFYI